MKKIIVSDYWDNEREIKVYQQRARRTRLVLDDYDKFIIIDDKPIRDNENQVIIFSSKVYWSDDISKKGKAESLPIIYVEKHERFIDEHFLDDYLSDDYFLDSVLINNYWTATDSSSEFIKEIEGFIWEDHFSSGVIRTANNKIDAIIKVLMEIV
jgi:hypothetical protein